MKFADSSRAGWMAGGMWDGTRIQNYLDALAWEEVRRGEGGREKEGEEEEREAIEKLYIQRRERMLVNTKWRLNG